MVSFGNGKKKKVESFDDKHARVKAFIDDIKSAIDLGNNEKSTNNSTIQSLNTRNGEIDGKLGDLTKIAKAFE